MNLIGRVAFKPTPTIGKRQKTIDRYGKEAEYIVEKEKRHDPCIALRGVSVVKAMCSIVLVDALLMQRIGNGA